MTTNTTRREAGNLHLGDVVMLPGDLSATVMGLEWLADAHDMDVMRLTTTLQTLTVRFSDTFEVLAPEHHWRHYESNQDYTDVPGYGLGG